VVQSLRGIFRVCVGATNHYWISAVGQVRNFNDLRSSARVWVYRNVRSRPNNSGSGLLANNYHYWAGSLWTKWWRRWARHIQFLCLREKLCLADWINKSTELDCKHKKTMYSLVFIYKRVELTTNYHKVFEFAGGSDFRRFLFFLLLWSTLWLSCASQHSIFIFAWV